MIPSQPNAPSQRIAGQLLPKLLTRVAPRSIRMKLIYAFLVVALVSTIGTALVSNLLLSRQLMNGAGEQIHSTAMTTGLMVGDLLDQEVATLQAFGVNKVVQDTVTRTNAAYSSDNAISQQRIQELDTAWRAASSDDAVIRSRLNNLVAAELRAYQATFPDNVEVFVTDGRGAVVAATERTSDYAQADEAWWQAAWNGGQGAIYLSQASVDESSNTFALVIAVPLYEESSRAVVGVLRSTYRLDTIMQRAGRVKLGQTGRVEIMLPGQQYLVDASTTTQFTSDEGAQLARQNSASWTMPLHQVERIVSLAPVAATDDTAIGMLGWRVLAYQDRAEIVSVARATSTNLLLIGLGTLLLASVLAVFIARTVSTPIQRLTNAAQQLAEGAFDQRITLRERDEIGTLATRFNEMAATIEQRTHALEAQYAQAEAARADAERAHTEVAAYVATIEQQQATIREMSVPILPVTPTALVMPLVGALDSARMRHMQTHALSTLAQTRARQLIVDVTGVAVIDTHVATCLVQLIRGARLLGTEVVLVGIRPEVAQTLVSLGVPLDMMLTCGSLQEGIAYTQSRKAAVR